MNPLNYASLEASKRLQDAGIFLETDYVFGLNIPGTSCPKLLILEKYEEILRRWADSELFEQIQSIPAPSMAEIWRVLTDSTSLKKLGNNHRAAWFELLSSWCVSDNPTDALIDLLIWDRKENSHD